MPDGIMALVAGAAVGEVFTVLKLPLRSPILAGVG